MVLKEARLRNRFSGNIDVTGCTIHKLLTIICVL